MAWTNEEQRRWEAVEAWVREKPEVFAVQGWIQTSAGIHRLCYRDGQSVRSLSLGRSQELADRVAGMLKELQWAERSRRFMKRLCRKARKERRRVLAEIDALLDRLGEPSEPGQPPEDQSDDPWLDGDWPEDDWRDEPGEDVQEVRRFAQSQPTGGKGAVCEIPFFDSAQRVVSQDQAAALLSAYKDLLGIGAAVQKRGDRPMPSCS